jgi:hypothetical protein
MGGMIGHAGINIVHLRAFAYFRFIDEALRHIRELFRGMVFQAASQFAESVRTAST